jgi:hypothetical protein
VEMLFISLSIEGDCLWSKNNVFWDVFTTVSNNLCRILCKIYTYI